MEKVRPSFPLTFETLIQTINQAFGDPSLKQLSGQVDEAREQVENCRTLVNLMNLKLLKHSELSSLAHIIHGAQQKGELAHKALNTVFNEVKGASEDVNGFVWDKIDGREWKHFKLPHEVLRAEKAALEREFANRRVR